MLKINLTLYGDIARFGGGKHIATLDLNLLPGTSIGDLLQELSLPPSERGYLFINAVLSDAPGLYASKDEPLRDNDHVGIFSIRHMWPYQYRDGIHMSDSLTKAMADSGAVRNTYRDQDQT